MSPRVREAEDALVRWKASIIRARRWRALSRTLMILSVIVGSIEIVRVHQRPIGGFIVLVAAFGVFAYCEMVLGGRSDVARHEVNEAMRALDFGNDDARAASRSILQSMIDFENPR